MRKPTVPLSVEYAPTPEGSRNGPMQSLGELPRVWAGTYLPGYHDWGDASPLAPTYAGFPLDWLPPIERELDDELRWLLREPPVDEPLEGSATRAELDALLAGKAVALPPSFAAFIDSAAARKRLRSATDCYLRLPDAIVRFGEGWLINFLADSQACAFWLLYTGSDGEAVVVTEYPPGVRIQRRAGKEPAARSWVARKRRVRVRRLVLGVPLPPLDRERDLLPPRRPRGGPRTAHRRAAPVRRALPRPHARRP